MATPAWAERSASPEGEGGADEIIWPEIHPSLPSFLDIASHSFPSHETKMRRRRFTPNRHARSDFNVDSTADSVSTPASSCPTLQSSISHPPTSPSAFSPLIAQEFPHAQVELSSRPRDARFRAGRGHAGLLPHALHPQQRYCLRCRGRPVESPATRGVATRLTSHPGNEGTPRISPDGSTFALHRGV